MKPALKKYGPGLLRLCILFALCAVVIWPALQGEFLQWDDDKNIYKNEWLLQGDWLRFWTEKFYFLLYIPVTYTFWTAVWAISNTPLAFHLFSLALHVLNCNWVYLIARKLFPEIKVRGAWLAMLFFALMPLQVEAFAWISGGRDLLGLQFSLAALYLLIAFESRAALIGSVALFAVGLLSKPTVAPLAVAVLAFGSIRQKFKLNQYITLGIWLLLAIPDLAWNRWVQEIGFDAKVGEVTLFERVLISFDTLGFYALKIIFPYPLNADYARMPWKVIAASLYWPSFLVLAVTAIAFVYIQKKFKVRVWEFTLYFLIALSPVLGFIPFLAQAQSTVADRYVYMPWIGFSFLLAIIAEKFKYGFHVACVVLLVWAGTDFARSQVWHDDDTLFLDMATKSPDSFTANNALGAFAFQRGQYEEAEKRFKVSHELMPHRAGVVSNLVQLYWTTNKKDLIRKEIFPLIRDQKWVMRNTAEYIPLSVIYLVTARVQKEDHDWVLANDSFCRAYQLYPENFSAKLEIVRSLAEIKQSAGTVVDCVTGK